MKYNIDFEALRLAKGAHDSPAQGMCVMEAVAYFHGLPHTERPPCVSPSIGAFLRSWSDGLNDDDRQKLKPYILKVVDTNTGPNDEERRAWLAVDWLTRTFAPAWLDLAGLKDHAAALRGLPELATDELARQAQTTINAAWVTAWILGGVAASDDTTGFASEAAGFAAWFASEAAGVAAWDGGEAAIRVAAWVTAGITTGNVQRPTVVVALQKDALRLLDRMIEVGHTEPTGAVA